MALGFFGVIFLSSQRWLFFVAPFAKFHPRLTWQACLLLIVLFSFECQQRYRKFEPMSLFVGPLFTVVVLISIIRARRATLSSIKRTKSFKANIPGPSSSNWMFWGEGWSRRGSGAALLALFPTVTIVLHFRALFCFSNVPPASFRQLPTRKGMEKGRKKITKKYSTGIKNLRDNFLIAPLKSSEIVLSFTYPILSKIGRANLLQSQKPWDD